MSIFLKIHKKSWGFLCLFAFCLFGFSTQAQEENNSLPMNASFQGSGKTPSTGDILNLELEFTLPEGAVLETPIKIDGLGENRPLSIKKTDKGLLVTLLADSLNEYSVDNLLIDFKYKNGNKGILKSSKASIILKNNLAKDPSKQGIRPAKGLLEAGAFNIYYYLSALAAFLILLSALLYLIKRKKGPPPIPESAPAHIIATNRLIILEEELVKGQISDKEYYFRLSMIIRAFMGALRGFPALEMTIEEIIAANPRNEDREMISLLRDAEKIKFAFASFPKSTMENHLALVKGYVEKESPKPEEENESGPGGGNNK